MANVVVRTYDLFNTTFYWKGYTVPNFETQLAVAQAYYITQFSSNIIGSQIDFFAELAGNSNQNPVFNLTTTIDKLPYFWAKYWWEEAVFYTTNTVSSILSATYPVYYSSFSESVGSLYYLSYYNNVKNILTKPYNSLLDSLLIPGLSDSIQGFYSDANSLFITNVSAIGPTGTDTVPNNSNLIMADTDLIRRINSNNVLTTTVNSFYPFLNLFLPYNNLIIGNLFTPYYWSTQLVYESGYITVDQTNSTISIPTQLITDTLKA